MSKTFWDGRVFWLIAGAVHFALLVLAVVVKDTAWAAMQTYFVGFCTAACAGRLK